jgi:hypothetical protein
VPEFTPVIIWAAIRARQIKCQRERRHSSLKAAPRPLQNRVFKRDSQNPRSHSVTAAAAFYPRLKLDSRLGRIVF